MVEEEPMKTRTVCILLLFMLFLSLTGCLNSPSPTPAIETSAEVPATSTPTAVPTESTLEPTFSAAAPPIQEGNTFPIYSLNPKTSGGLADNRIGAFAGGLTGGGWKPGEPWDYTWMVDQIVNRGVKRFRVAIDNLDAGSPDLDWSIPQYTIDPSHDKLISLLAQNGITLTYVLTFWDKDTWPGGEGAGCPRFKTQDEIDRYLEFVKYMVHHLKDRVVNYEIWNEPNNQNCPQWIEAADYVNLVSQAVTVIRQEYPEARVVVGSTSYLGEQDSQNYLFAILNSDVMSSVDVVAWHPMYGTSPEFDEDYYSAYPSIVQNIKDTAEAHGFTGTYEADELTWFTIDGSNWDGWSKRYSDIAAAKYTARGVVMHLGMDVTAGIGSALIFDSNWKSIPTTVQNLSTVMAGAEPIDLPFEMDTEAGDVVSYTFSVPEGGLLVAYWSDGVASDDEHGVTATVTLPDLAGQSAFGMDVLHGFKQELLVTNEDGNLVIDNLLIKDYPIFILLTDSNS